MIVKPYISRSVQLGIAVEVELGRLEGGEAGLRALSNARLTDPHQAESFLGGTGAHILAPSIGNLHGEYLQPPNFRIDMCVVLASIAIFIVGITDNHFEKYH